MHMDRTATGIALGVILFVSVVIGVLIVRGQRASAPGQEAVSSDAARCVIGAPRLVPVIVRDVRLY